MGVFVALLTQWYLETLGQESKRAAGSAPLSVSREENAGPLVTCNRKKGPPEVDSLKARLQVYGARATT